MNNKRHSYNSGNSKGIRHSVPGTRDKDQICIFLLYHIWLHTFRFFLWMDISDHFHCFQEGEPVVPLAGNQGQEVTLGSKFKTYM